MKILCETHVINRQTQGSNKNRAAKRATLAIGYHSLDKDANGNSAKELEIIHFTPQNKAGVRYKLRDNIEKIFTKFIQDGKATISFVQPPENLMIKCDPLQLKSFLQALKLGIEGKDSINIRLNIAATTAIPQKSQPQEKLVVLHRSDYPTKGFPKSLKQLKISGIQLCKVTFDICSLRNLTALDMSYNNLTKLPLEFGRLPLKQLHINNNALGATNTWQWLQGKVLQNSLRDLDLSANNIAYLPQQLIKLKQLVTLKLNNNNLRRLPFGVRRMKALRYLHISSNKLESLPAIFNHARLDLLDVWGNNFQSQTEHRLDGSNAHTSVGSYSVAPLWLLAARTVTQYKLPYSTATLPWVLVDILSESPECACGKLCYEDTILERAAEATFENVKELVNSRDRLIYSDIVLCGINCAGRKHVLV